MNIKNLALATVGAVMFALPVSAAMAGDTGVVADEDSPAANDDATIRCKRVPPPVGSRLGAKKVCKTNAAWRLERESAASTARENQDRSATGNTRTSG